MSALKAIKTAFIRIFNDPTDPVKHCKVYKDKANGSCAHVDGPLCDFNTCSIRLNYDKPSELREQYDRNITKEGFVLVQENRDMAVCLDHIEYQGVDRYHWLMIREGDKWLPVRQLVLWEVMQAEDQRDGGIIIQGKDWPPATALHRRFDELPLGRPNNDG